MRCGQRVLQIMNLNTLVDVVRVPKARTSQNFMSICIGSVEKSCLN